MTRRQAVALAATAGSVGLGAAHFAPANAADSPEKRELSRKEIDAVLEQTKEPQSCRLLPRTIHGSKAKAQVVPGFINNTFILIVHGAKPYLNMKVTLSPLIYVRQPDYWAIEVVGCVSGIVLPTIGYYDESLPLDQFRGKRGIEVVWADGRRKFDVPPKAEGA